MRKFQVLAFAVVLLAAAGWALAGDGKVDEVRFGTTLDAEGEVPKSAETGEFPHGVPLYITLRVQEAPTGTPLLMTILDRETEEVAWTGTQSVSTGHNKLKFTVPALNAGKYRARVKLGDDLVSEHEFEIGLD